MIGNFLQTRFSFSWQCGDAVFYLRVTFLSGGKEHIWGTKPGWVCRKYRAERHKQVVLLEIQQIHAKSIPHIEWRVLSIWFEMDIIIKSSGEPSLFDSSGNWLCRADPVLGGAKSRVATAKHLVTGTGHQTPCKARSHTLTSHTEGGWDRLWVWLAS